MLIWGEGKKKEEYYKWIDNLGREWNVWYDKWDGIVCDWNRELF